MIINDDFIFFHMPRTGGTFITKWLAKNSPTSQEPVDTIIGGEWFTTATHAGPMHLCQQDFRERNFWFSFIRNPFDWYVSKWAYRFPGSNFREYMLDALNEENLVHIAKFVTHTVRFPPSIIPGGSDRWKEMLGEHIHGLMKGREFDVPTWDFSRALCPFGTKFDIGLMTHRYLQVCCAYPFVYWDKWSDWTDRHDELCLMDKVYKYEDGVVGGMADALKLNQNQIDNLSQQGRVNLSKRKPYQEYYDQELIDLVYYKDRFIFDAYGYEF